MKNKSTHLGINQSRKNYTFIKENMGTGVKRGDVSFFFQVIRACVLTPYFSLNFLWLLLWKKLLIFGSRISLLSPNITSFMFSQVTALLPSGLCYLGHLQHSVRALCLISVALVTHLLSQMPLTYKDSLSHPIFHGCMAYTSDWILFDLHKPFALL